MPTVDYTTAEDTAEQTIYDLICQWTGDAPRKQQRDDEFEGTYNHWIFLLGAGSQPDADQARQVSGAPQMHRATARWQGLYSERGELRKPGRIPKRPYLTLGLISGAGATIETIKRGWIEKKCFLHNYSNLFRRGDL